MNAEVRQREDQCRAGAGRCLSGREGQAAGRPQGRGAARGRSRPLRRARLAAPPGRGVEIHRSPRADRARRSRSPARRTPPPRRAPRRPASSSATWMRGASCSSTARSCRSLSDLADLSPGLTIRSMAQALAAGDRAGRRQISARSCRPNGEGVVALNTALMRDGAVIHVAKGATRRAADPSGVRRDRRQAGLGVHPLAGRDRAGRARHAGREPRRQCRPSGQYRARARGRRQRPCRSHQDHQRAERSRSRLVADGRDRRAMRASTISPSTSAAAWCATRLSCASTARARMRDCAARACSRASSTSIPRWWSITRPAAARAARCSRPCSTTRAAACSRARSWCGQHAQKTDARMMTRALLLSDEAEADNKPELEIFADDVQCGHGATVRRARRGPASSI